MHIKSFQSFTQLRINRLNSNLDTNSCSCYVENLDASLRLLHLKRKRDHVFVQMSSSCHPPPHSLTGSGRASEPHGGAWGEGLWRVGFPQLAASGPVGACYLCQQPVEQPTKQPESKEALGTPLIVHALGSS